MYPHRPTKEIAGKLGRSVTAIYRKAALLGLHKTDDFLNSPLSGILRKGHTRKEGVPFQFPKGHAPANKGLRRPGWFSGRMRETQFKKGQRTGKAAKNWKPIGSILPDAEGYFRIKVREAEHSREATGFGNTKVWPLLQRYIWEEHNGPIPPTHIVAFKDGNRANCALDNLECIHRRELARRNCMWNRYPRQLAEAIQMTGALKRQIRKQEKEYARKKK